MTDLLLVSCALGMCGGRVPKPFSNISTYYVWFNSWALSWLCIQI